ncbi:MAG: DUF427 domain-containing protein [Solirubrobacteraceae bacterium]
MTVTATLGGVTIAASDHTVMIEGNHYFPPADVQMRLLHPNARRSLCFWKGIARYFDIEADGVRAASAAWSYPRPSPLARRIKGHIAFWGDVEVRRG